MNKINTYNQRFKSEKTRFWEKVAFPDDNECWNWIGGIVKRGYGSFGIRCDDNKIRMKYAHRIAWEYCNGKIPIGMNVLHHCDNPRCVNPTHLFLGTHSDNMVDMHSKSRGGNLVGEKSNLSKLSEKDVLKIRNYYKDKKYNQYELAFIFNVSQACISDIVNRKTWKHII